MLLLTMSQCKFFFGYFLDCLSEDFNPSKEHFNPIKDACWGLGEP